MSVSQSLQQLELPSWQWTGGGGVIAAFCLLWAGSALLKKAPKWGVLTAWASAKVLIGKPAMFALLAGTAFAGLGMFRQSALGNAAAAQLAAADSKLTETLLSGGVKAESITPVKVGGGIGILTVLAVMGWQMKEDAKRTFAKIMASPKTGVVGVIACLAALLGMWGVSKTTMQPFQDWTWPQWAAGIYGTCVVGILSCLQGQEDKKDRLKFQAFMREYAGILAVCLGVIPGVAFGICHALETAYPAQLATSKVGYEVLTGIIALMTEGLVVGHRVSSDEANNSSNDACGAHSLGTRRVA